MSETPSNGIPFVPENTLDPAAGLNLSLNAIDVLLQLRVETLGENAPPGSPVDGERHVVGTAPTAEWEGEANRVARYIEEGNFWQFYDASIALNDADGALYKFTGGQWMELTSTTGIDSFLGQTDTPGDYAGMEGRLVAVNGAEDGLEFVELIAAILVEVGGEAGDLLRINSAEDGLEAFAPLDRGAGDTASRPTTPPTGGQYFDTDLGQPIWWNGTEWVDAMGGSLA